MKRALLMSDGRLKTEIPLGGLLALVPLMPIYVIAQLDQILSKHRRICCHPPTSAPPDGPTAKQVCPAMECTG